GIELSGEHLTKLEAYLDLVEEWSARMNLVGKASREELVERHLLDSLAPTVLVAESRIAADFGSGAGFPAVPLAVVRSDLQVHLIESRRKRTSFLRQVLRTLPLPNAVVAEPRGEEWQPPRAIDLVMGRALAAATLATLADRVLADDGRLIVMRKQ